MKKIFVVFGIGLILTLSSCKNNPKEKPAPAAMTSISIGVQNSSISGIIFIAKKLGYFKNNGLDVRIKKYPSGKLAFRGMLNNEVDFATSADIPIAINAINKKKFKIICTIAETDDGAWIIARKDKGINNPMDLKGKIIGTQGQSAVHFFLHLFGMKYKISDNVQVKLMPAVELVDALLRGDIDAFSMRNPFIAEAKEKLKDNYIEFFEENLYVQSFNLVARNDVIDKYNKNLQALIRSLLAAETIMNKNEKKAIESLITVFGEDHRDEITAGWSKFDFKISLKQYLIILLEDETNFVASHGLINDKQFPNFLDYIYIEPLLKEAPEKISIIK